MAKKGTSAKTPWQIASARALEASGTGGPFSADAAEVGEDARRALGGWVPTDDQRCAIAEARNAVGVASNPSQSEARRKEAMRRLPRLLAGVQELDVLRTLASQHVRQRLEAAAGTMFAPAPAAADPLAASSASDWAREETEFTIYLDERWPELESEVGRVLGEATFAGIVWQGAAPDEVDLPLIKDHIRSGQQHLQALQVLLACGRAFPFIMPLRGEPGEQMTVRYDELVRVCIRTLLGWVLPADGALAEVRIHLHQYGNHPHESDATGYYRGLLARSRYRRWKVAEVKWFDLKQADTYIPYGDLLAYLAGGGGQTVEAGRLRERVMGLPGYLPISLKTADHLERLEHLETAGDFGDFLDLAAELAGTNYLGTLTANVRRRLSGRADLQNRLLQELDQRYIAENRNLEALRPQFKAVEQIIQPPLDLRGASKRMQLLWAALELQHANHHGDPLAARRAVKTYQRLRNEMVPDESVLVAYCDLHMMVSVADRFEFDKALKLATAVRDDPNFHHLPRPMQGRVWSSLGQYQAMLGRHAEADASFDRALELFARAEYDEATRERDTDQSGVYRAINAMDGALPCRQQRLEMAIGLPLPGAAEEAAADRAGTLPYHHHLVVRALALHAHGPPLWDDAAAAEATDRYLARRDVWHDGSQHPWPLIDCYRGLLLWDRDRPGAADRFNHAVRSAAASPHGPTLKLVAGMIGVVAWCRTGEPAFKQQARRHLAEAAAPLPSSAAAATALLAIISDGPADRYIAPALTALPFNYH